MRSCSAMPALSLIQWQKRFGTEQACVKALVKVRWPDGFQCPHAATQKHTSLPRASSTNAHAAGTVFHAARMSLVKRFWAIYPIASDKGGISALRASKHLGVSWPAARSMLRKIRQAMVHRDSMYRLSNLIELGDAFTGGKRCGKRGRGADGLC